MLKNKNKVRQCPHFVSKSPKVSVCIQTYMHEGFLRESLESILNQKTNFEFEILLGEDDSSDTTRAICLEYANNYPSKIRLFLHDRSNVMMIGGNITGRYNFIYNLKSSNGKYIAFCEGDDYWTDPLKLQKQVDYLENHPEAVITFCNTGVVYEDGKLAHRAYMNEKMPEGYLNTINIPKENTIPYDLAKGNYIHTPGVMFRNSIKNDGLPEYIYQTPVGDWPLYMYLLRNGGTIFYMNEVMAAYRVHQGGVYSTQSYTKKLWLSLGQYPYMLTSGLFSKEILIVWRERVKRDLLKIYSDYGNLKTDENIARITNLFSEKEPLVLVEVIEELANTLAQKNNELKVITSSKSYKRSIKLTGWIVRLKQLLK